MSPRIRPQPGPQWNFHASLADIVFFGGGAGGGKSYSLLLEPLRHSHNPQFGAVLFRRTSVQLMHEGSLWDTSDKIYPSFGGRGSSHNKTWRFPSGAAISMSGLEHEKDCTDWQSAQICYLGFDEVTHFSERQFWYMQSRNRSTCGVRSYTRAACNPDPDSWVKKFIQWWIDNRPTIDGKPNPGFGFPFPSRDGVLRWFVRINDRLEWAFEKEDLEKKYGVFDPMTGRGVIPKSVTFIRSKVYDNPALLEKDPNYLATLLSLPLVERAQLLDGNWEVRWTAGTFFPRHKVKIVKDAPPRSEWEASVRYWDRAATEQRAGADPDATVGTLYVLAKDGYFYICDVRKLFAGPHEVNQAMIKTASQDGLGVEVSFMEDPGSSGIYEAQDTAKELAALGYMVSYAKATGAKTVRAKPVSKAWTSGLVRMVEAPWNDETLRVLENFPEGKHDDEVDSLSGGHERVTNGRIVLVA